MIRFSVPPSTTGFDILDLFESRGFVAFHSDGGNIVLILHANEDGDIAGLDDVLAYLPVTPDVVVCCYPAAVLRQNAGLPVVGDWEGKTIIEAFLDYVEVYADGQG